MTTIHTCQTTLPCSPPSSHPAGAAPECLVDQYYQPLLRFALGLTRSPCQAGDLVQQTFYLWALRGHQLREQHKVKSWLHTTLYREFLREVRRRTTVSEVEFDDDLAEMPTAEPRGDVAADAAAAVRALHLVGEPFQAPLRLFYLEELSYLEIARTLGIPLGTVMSRLSRGRAELRDRFQGGGGPPDSVTTAPFPRPDGLTAPPTARRTHEGGGLPHPRGSALKNKNPPRFKDPSSIARRNQLPCGR